MNELATPLGMRHAQQIGFDELGRPLYRLPTGQTVGTPMPERQNALATALRTELDSQGRAIHYQDEVQPTRTGNALAGIASGFLNGLATPGRAARGEAVSLGDTWATALDWGAMSAPMEAPRGAIRSGAMRSVDDYAGGHRAPRREYGSSLDDPTEMFGGSDIYTSRAANYFGHGDARMDAESLRQINAARGNPDAMVTIYRAVPSGMDEAVVNPGDWVTLSRRYADTHGQGPLGGDYRIIDSRVRAGDLMTDGDIHEWGWSPAATAPTGPADEIARMLREGRASDITDDMMAALSPEDNAQLYRLYQEGATGQAMPMDEASRMGRARDMGFDTDTRLYHGAREPFDRFTPSPDGFTGPGVYTTPLADDASEYAMEHGVTGQNGLEVVGHGDGFVDERHFSAEVNRTGNNPGYGEYPARRQATGRAMAADGVTGVDVRNQGWVGDEYKAYLAQRSFFDPSNIRSRFARFDPRLSHLAHLSAGGAGVAVLGGAEGGDEQGGYEASLRRYLQEIGQ